MFGVLVAAIGFLLLPTAGQAGGVPVLSWSPSGTYDLGSSGSSHSFTLTNSGGSATGALMVTLGGANPSQFSISHNTCSGTSLGPKKHCSLTVTYTEAAPGTSDTATLTAMSKKAKATASVILNGATVTDNLVPNPSFSDDCSGVPCMWVLDFGAISTDTSFYRSAPASMALTASSQPVFGGESHSGCFPISPSTTYTVGGWYSTTSPGIDETFGIGGALIVYSGSSCDGTRLPNIDANASSVTTGAWTSFSGQGTTSPNAQSAFLNLGVNCAIVDTNATCDSVKVNFDDTFVRRVP